MHPVAKQSVTTEKAETAGKFAPASRPERPAPAPAPTWIASAPVLGEDRPLRRREGVPAPQPGRVSQRTLGVLRRSAGPAPVVIRRQAELDENAAARLSAEDKAFIRENPDRERFEAWLTREKRDEPREILGMWSSVGTLTHVSMGEVTDDAKKETPAVKVPGMKSADLAKAVPTQGDPDHDKVDIRKDTVITHTHPSGSALSRGDVSIAVDGDVAEIRAIGRFGWFSLRRPNGGWPAGKEVLATILAAYTKTGPELWKTHAAGLGSRPAPDVPLPDTPAPESSTPKPAAHAGNGRARSSSGAARAKLSALGGGPGGETPVADWRPKDASKLLAGATFAEDMFMQKFFANQALANGGIGEFSTNANPATMIEDRLALYEPRAANPTDKSAGRAHAQDLADAGRDRRPRGGVRAGGGSAEI